MHSQLAGPDISIWRHVDFELSAPYFLVNYEYDEDHHRFNQTKVIFNLHDLVTFCGSVKESESAILKQLAMISPSWMNRSSGWQMADITEIFYAQITGSESTVPVFVTKSGETMVESVRFRCDQSYEKTEALFSMEG